MKAYILKGIGQLEYEDTALPELKPGWVLVKVAAAGICASDLPRIFELGTYHFPTIPGHEFAGTVVDACDKEGRSWLGKRVGVFPLIPCQKCFVCQEGRYEMCRNYDYLGSRRDGGFAEYVAVPVWNLLELPDAMPIDEAAMLEPASVALHAVDRLTLHADDTVALYGLGSVGRVITQWLHIYGISSIYAVGRKDSNEEQAKRAAFVNYEYLNVLREESAGSGDNEHAMPADAGSSGPDPVAWIQEKTDGRGASIVIDCAGTVESVTNCLNSVRPGGQLLLVGNPKGEMRLDQASYWKILRNQIRVIGTWNSTFCHDPEDDWHRAVTAATEGQLHLSELITHRLPFDQLMKGLLIEKDHTEYYNKIMICADQTSALGK